jgi:hypothetical protein
MIWRTALFTVPLLLLASCSGEKGNPPAFRMTAEEEGPAHREATVPSAPGDGQSVKILPANAAGGARSNAPPEIRSVKFVPEVFLPGDSLGVEVSGSDPDGDEVTFEYAWEKNGVPAGRGSRIEGALKRRDAISVTITPFDGEVRGKSLTLRREIRNVPPTIEGVKDARLVGDVYSCRIFAVDADGDPLTFVLKDAPSGMSIEATTGTIRWEIPPGVRGKVPVTVSVSDGSGGNASYAMVVTLREETAPQVLQPGRESGEPRQGVSSDQPR